MPNERPKINIKQALIVDDLTSIATVMNNLQIMYAQQQARLTQIQATTTPEDLNAAQAYVKWQADQIIHPGASHPATNKEQ
ncbi:MAG: hypothetical protein K8953_10155 [Proteobacteria bacterium]|nr:hypothetical protein [Pseudomonadota bacterium]